MFLNAKYIFYFNEHKKSSLKVYFDTNIKNSTLINRAWWQG